MCKDRSCIRTIAHWSAPVVAAVLITAAAPPASAQYFGRNKVRYEDFDFRVLRTSHFDIHFYREVALASEDAARMAERWYDRYARFFQHDFRSSKPLVLYADHGDFEQTNILEETIDEATGGVTESLKNRVTLPLAGSYRETDHVIGHELVHAFQYDLAQAGRGGGMAALSRLPLWVVEGMAEYLSLGRESPLTAMWMRDALARDDVPTIERMSWDYRYFPYRFGHALWAYIAGVYGDDAVVELYRRALMGDWEMALEQSLGIRSDSLSARWKEALKAAYLPVLEGRTPPAQVGRLIVGPGTGAGTQNVAPALSPDGRYLAFLSERDLFTIDLYLADAETGQIVRKLASSATDPHFDALRYLGSAGSWSPDGTRLVSVVAAGGDDQLAIIAAASGKIERRIAVPDIGAITNPAWAPDGGTIAFSGSRGGITDLYLLDLATESARQLTDDRYADLQPAWAPDGRTLAFVSDRSPQTDFDRLSYSRYQLALIEVESATTRTLRLFTNARHSNPQFSPDGRSLYFLSDQDGVSDVYRVDLRELAIDLDDGSLALNDARVDLDGGSIDPRAEPAARLTRLTTGVSGITELSQAMSVASRAGTIAVSVFHDRGFAIQRLEADAPALPAATVPAGEPAAAVSAPVLPPAVPAMPTRVAAYLDDPDAGLPAPGSLVADSAGSYRPALTLDYVGVPTIGVAVDRFGTYIGGSVSFYFSDMLGDHFLGLAAQANGTLKDVGAQGFYLNRVHRLNWGLAAGRTPYLYSYYSFGGAAGGALSVQEIRERLFIDSALGLVAYPLSSTRRLEANLGLTRYSYDLEVLEYTTDPFGQVTDRTQRQLETPEPLYLVENAAALVGDRSLFAFSSPARGMRYRFEVGSALGTVNYLTLLGDYRRYVQPASALTLAARGLHYGRYGNIATLDDHGIQPLFLGYQTLVRGYEYGSFESRECTVTAASGCAELERLFAHRVAVANLEARVPLIGTDRYGLLHVRFLPIEIAAFGDAGLAWDSERQPSLDWRTTSAQRVPVFSTGVSARLAFFGAFVLEIYRVYPFQRPEKGWHWGFQIAPGW